MGRNSGIASSPNTMNSASFGLNYYAEWKLAISPRPAIASDWRYAAVAHVRTRGNDKKANAEAGYAPFRKSGADSNNRP